ncbi:SPOR domain-containing protein [Acidovorax sp. CF316]|uniref:SPOR domain-containing protein n=1 Tax=Acidovorax sp. CF316 TaxID=1144317 RepID=UPI000559793A|nr:SPOR domain-containing protein [Acidovorax sp. CF316]
MPLTLDPANAIAPMSLDSPSDNAMTALYRVALGPVNTEHYLPIFARFDDAGRTTTTWNWPAALFTLSWLVFRQLWGAALVYVAAAEGLALLVFGLGRQFLNWPQPVEWGILAAIALFSCALPGLFANAVLHTEIRKRIARALSASRTVPEAAALLERQASSRQRLSSVVIGHVVVVATALLAYMLFPPGGAAEPARAAASTTSAPSAPAAPASNPTSGLAAVSVLRSAASAPPAPPEAVAPPSAAAPASAQEASAPAAVASAPAPVAAPAAASRRQPASSPAAAAPPVPPALPAAKPAPPITATASAPKAMAPAAPTSKPAPSAAQAPAAATSAAGTKAKAGNPATPASKPATPAAAGKAASKASPPAPSRPPASAASDPELTMVGSAPGFYINVGLFAEEANARKTQSRLLNEGLPAFRQPLESAKGTRIRVRVGPFDSKAEADTAAQAIQRMGLEAVVFKK